MRWSRVRAESWRRFSGRAPTGPFPLHYLSFLTPTAPLHSIRAKSRLTNHLMAPGTGTPDYVASPIRIRSTCRRGTVRGARLSAALLSISLVLTGCALQPRAPGAPADAKTGHSAAEPVASDPGPPSFPETAQSSGAARAVSGVRPQESPKPAELALLDDSPALPPGPRPDQETASDRDAWDRIRGGLELQYPKKKQVDRAIEWYRRNPEYLDRLTQRARPYLAYIVREVEKRGLPMEFALLPVVESAFRERAYSPAGASGLWQFMPSTGRRYGLKQNWWYDGRRDIVESTRAALDYLTNLLEDFRDDPLLAVAAYNWGEGNVRRAMSRNRARGKSTDVWSLRLPRETRIHVRRFAAIATIVEQPDRFGVVLESIPDEVYFRPVSLDDQVDLVFAANLAGISVREIRRLNPGFKRSTTAPGGPHRIQLPVDAAERFASNLALLPAEKHMRWARHAVVRGDTLGHIAIRYGTSVRALKDTNGLSSDRIMAGTHLTIPMALGVRGGMQPGATSPAADSSGADAPTTTIHRVRSGDSLWLIARRHGVDVEQLAAWNGLSIESVLLPGQRLTVHRGRAGGAPPGALRTDPSKTSRANGFHVVQYGETLSGIAERHGTTVTALTDFNRIHEDAILRTGQKLRLIPAAYAGGSGGEPQRIRYRVRRGDSLWEISRQFGVSIASLRRWNRLSRNELLMPGRELLVHLSDAPTI